MTSGGNALKGPGLVWQGDGRRSGPPQRLLAVLVNLPTEPP